MSEEIKWDKWQKDIINHKGHVTLRKGRQVGGSTTGGRRRADLMKEHVGSKSLIVAPSQRQSSELYKKTMSWLYADHYKAIEEAGGYKSDPKASAQKNTILRRQFEAKHGIFNETPTKTTVVLKKDFNAPQGVNNEGSICYALPAGKTGDYLRTFALDFIDWDEAAYIPDAVHIALKPMLAVSEKKTGLGWESQYSTPLGKGGFFYDSHQDDEFKRVHVSAEDCPRISRSFLRKQRQKLSKVQYAQEWLGEFIDEFNQFFPTSLIKDRMNFIDSDKRIKDSPYGWDYFIGVDVARYGADETAYIISRMNKKKRVEVIRALVREKRTIPQTVGEIKRLHETYNFNKMIIDDAGLGAGVFDLLKEQFGRRKVIAMNNSKKSEEKDARTGQVLKEDMYSNALSLMEQKKVDIVSSMKLLKSLKGMTFEYTHDAGKPNLKIYGKYSHLAEAFVRACWCVKTKSLNLFIA